MSVKANYSSVNLLHLEQLTNKVIFSHMNMYIAVHECYSPVQFAIVFYFRFL